MWLKIRFWLAVKWWAVKMAWYWLWYANIKQIWHGIRFHFGLYRGEFDPMFDLDPVAVMAMSHRRRWLYMARLAAWRETLHRKTL